MTIDAKLTWLPGRRDTIRLNINLDTQFLDPNMHCIHVMMTFNVMSSNSYTTFDVGSNIEWKIWNCVLNYGIVLTVSVR